MLEAKNTAPIALKVFPFEFMGFEISLRACLKNGHAGDSPPPVGDPPTGTAEAPPCEKAVVIGSNRRSRSVRRVAG